MSSVRICPNCGAGVVGNTPNCPRCDHMLDSVPDTLPAQERVPEPVEPQVELTPDTFQMMAITDEPIPEPLKTSELENAQTAPVPPDMVGASAPPPPVYPLSMTQGIPPAPYTPPPLISQMTASQNAYSYPSNYYLQQRIEAYRQGGYTMRQQTAYQAVMAYGKPLSCGWWLVSLAIPVAFIWYILIQLTSGFSKDIVYLVMERDGSLYEDGVGAAHNRLYRSRRGRFWGFFGFGLFFVALLSFVLMVALGVVGINEYRAELRELYPDITLFEGGTASVSQADVDFAQNLSLAYAVAFSLAAIGLFAGATLTLIGFLHSAAYRVDVPQLPDYV